MQTLPPPTHSQKDHFHNWAQHFFPFWLICNWSATTPCKTSVGMLHTKAKSKCCLTFLSYFCLRSKSVVTQCLTLLPQLPSFKKCSGRLSLSDEIATSRWQRELRKLFFKITSIQQAFFFCACSVVLAVLICRLMALWGIATGAIINMEHKAGDAEC